MASRVPAHIRRAYGVYDTPAEVVGAQVRFVDDVLRRCLGCGEGFGDDQVLIVDPACGSGAYPLAILERAGDPRVRERMRLFEVLPEAAALARAHGLLVEERDALATVPDLQAPIVVCLGNPPYRRRASDAAAGSKLDGLATGAPGIHLKNLYNDYVYFWRWALKLAFEQRSGPAIVCLVTAASYLRGPAFGGFRQTLRRVLDDLWLIDLEGDRLAARASDNVFPIRTPVAIALGVRYASARPDQPAAVRYTRLRGTRDAKLAALEAIATPADLEWQMAPGDWRDAFTATPATACASWPLLTELFPWQISGAQLKRTWPIAPTPEALRARWARLLELPPDERDAAFGITRDRNPDSAPSDLRDPSIRLTPLRQLAGDSLPLEPVRYAYRSFDRHWVLPDARLGDFMRPALWRSVSPRQIFLTSLLTNVLGPGPAAVVTRHVPDLDHFRGSFGARAVIPLWRDATATEANVSDAWLERLSERYGFRVDAEALMAYCYALLATPNYVERFGEELRTPGPRVPLTPDSQLFKLVVELGTGLLALHTFQRAPMGEARCVASVRDSHPRVYTYDARSETLALGGGEFAPIRRGVWEFSVSGYHVIPAWIRHRLPKRGKSILDSIPPVWTPALTSELLEVVWVIEATLGLEQTLSAFLERVVSGCGQERWLVDGPLQHVADGVGPERA